MKKIIILPLLLFFSVISYGQFKSINGEFNSKNKGEKHQILNPLRDYNPSMKRHSETDFHVNSLSEDLLNVGKNVKRLSVTRDLGGIPIAINAEIEFNDFKKEKVLENMYTYIESLKDIFAIDNVQKELKLYRVDSDELGMVHARAKQFYQDVEVYGGELIAHGPNGKFNFVNGRFHRIGKISVIPEMEPVQSEELAIADAGGLFEKEGQLNIFEIEPIKTELVIYPYNNSFYLAYHHTLYSDLMNRWEYFIDANTGDVINKYSSICKFHNHAHHHNCGHSHFEATKFKDNVSNSNTIMQGPEKATAVDLLGQTREIDVYSVGSTFYMIDGSRDMFNPQSNLPNEPEGAIWTIDAFNTSPQNNNFDFDHVKSNNNTWNDRSSVSAQFNGAKAYLYFRNLHQRNSINGSGGNIISLVNVSDEAGNSMGNAFWNGAAMFYGNGDAAFFPLAAGLDVAGHEMTHGVIQNTANLEYQGESGALNESFADVFGAMIDREDWLIGEDVVKTNAFPSGALRSMQDPHNGAATGDFGSGWQPKKYSERFTGSQDNGGVHINSGIPNHAFFLFATDSRLGNTENERKIKAERVYYRALSQYLTKSSQFVDCRIAVVNASKDLFGDQVAQAAREAFDAVEIFGGNGTTTQTDAENNPGSDLILMTNANNQGLYIFTPDGQEIANPLSNSNPISRPSVTDAGDLIVFVDEDRTIHYIQIDWSVPNATENSFNISGPNAWRNAVISKDGRLLAALREGLDNEVVIFDITTGFSSSYELKNPTYTTGISTGDVLYADAMEFDYSNEYLMYDANNRIESTTAGSIDFWDIGFIKVWNKQSETFALPDQIEKLFQGLPEGISIGNPTFSKNSNYVIAFDFIEDNEASILGANIETGDIGLIFENTGLAYPSYSRLDDQLVFDNPNNNTFDLGIAPLASNKIEASENPFLFFEGARWGVWFSNGVRNYTSVNDLTIKDFGASVYPNPAHNIAYLNVDLDQSQILNLTIVNSLGMTIRHYESQGYAGENSLEVNLDNVPVGQLFLKVTTNNQSFTIPFVKM